MKTKTEKDKDIAQRLGHAIAQRRAATGLSQEKLGELLDIGYEAVSRMERGVAMPTVVRIYKLADIFGCEVVDLFMQASPRSKDQSLFIYRMIEELSPKDRDLVLDTIRSLAIRLKS